MNIDEEYFNSEEFRELLDSYETSAESGSLPFMDVDDLVDLADYYNFLGDSDKATEAIDHALQLYPHATLPNVFKAREALLQDDLEGASAYADNISERDEPDYHYLIAEIKIAAGKVDEADNYLREYGRTVPADEHEDFIRDCANLFIDYDISDKAYEWMMRSKGDDGDDFKELMARTLFGLGRYDDSERIFNELIDHHPFSKRYWNALANTQFMKEDFNSSITSSEYAIAIDPTDPEGLISKATSLFRLGNFEEAQKYYQRYAEQIPNDDFCMFYQAMSLINLERMEEAAELLENVTQISEEASMLIPAYQELILCYNTLKQPQKALETIARAEDDGCDHVDMLIFKGHVLLGNEQIDEAAQAFKEAIELTDNTPATLLRIIVSLYDNRFVHSCYEMFKKYFCIIDGQGNTITDGYSYMALCCHDLGKKDEFLKYLRLATQKNANEARIVLGFMFPEGMKVEDYYHYMYKQLKD